MPVDHVTRLTVHFYAIVRNTVDALKYVLDVGMKALSNDTNHLSLARHRQRSVQTWVNPQRKNPSSQVSS